MPFAATLERYPLFSADDLGPLKDFAERMNVAISTITHPPKSSSQRAIDHFIGSHPDKNTLDGQEKHSGNEDKVRF
jgi:hypothetical protein